jgi:hypothetical protein
METPRNQSPSRVDWPAVERDFRTGKFTTRELGGKYGCSHAAVGQRARKEGWKQDLAQAVRQATSAILVEGVVVPKAVHAQVSRAVSKEAKRQAASTFQTTQETILAAAEVNKSVILCHRDDIKRAREAAMGLLEEVRMSGLTDADRVVLLRVLADDEDADAETMLAARAAIVKLTSLPVRVTGVKALADALTKLQAAERVAFGLDDKGEKDPAAPLDQALGKFIAAIQTAEQGRAPVVRQPLRAVA